MEYSSDSVKVPGGLQKIRTREILRNIFRQMKATGAFSQFEEYEDWEKWKYGKQKGQENE